MPESTCSTCPHFHDRPPDPFAAVVLGLEKIGECRGGPVQGRIIKGQWMVDYTPVPETMRACAMHPEYVAAREVAS